MRNWLVSIGRSVKYISRKLELAEWGEGFVDRLAGYLARTQPGMRGFTRASLFRMRQFYDAYRLDKKVAPLVRQLSWTHHLIILGQCKRRRQSMSRRLLPSPPVMWAIALDHR